MKTEIHTARLRIMEPRMSLAKLYVSWLNDPEIVKYSEQRHRQHTDYTQINYMYENEGAYHGIFLTDNAETPIGTITAHIDIHNKVANVGIMIGDKSQQNKGYGYEAWKALCDDLLSNGIRKVEAGCMEINRPMRKICGKYGMSVEAVVPDHFLYEDMAVDKFLFGKFAK